MKLNKKIIIQKLEKNSSELRRRGAKKIGLFGSYLKGKQKPKSDIDLIVTLDKKGEENYLEINFYLEDLFKKNVDLVPSKSLVKRLKHVKKEAEYARL